MNAIVTLCDYQRITTLKYIIGAIRGDGCWHGDLWAIMQSCRAEDIAEIERAGVRVLACMREESGYAGKYRVFGEQFKQYDQALYLDPDFLICRPLKILFEKCNTEDMYWVREPWPMKEWFNNGYLKSLDFDENTAAFNSGAMLFKPKATKPEEVDDLFRLHRDMRGQDISMGGEGDQPKINVFFREYHKPSNEFPDNLVCYCTSKDERTVAAHTCRWRAPWLKKHYSDYFERAMRRFRSL